ncbi:hypothetical protein HIM_08868 [Hirsutella minnesotensis 3608]|uniref:Mannan endo-1,6-alpha-mannosidase n=1 Tax=Hirsutella minnesotensis 3608 TaxID=1043627 RepID=A0A0F7ZGZ0_9HYPO|nr:hypothetical protein HIM_08868 [Hirsutella minnesotensis 3608]
MTVAGFFCLALLLRACGLAVADIQVDWTSDDSIRKAASVLAADSMGYYEGDQPGKVPGLLYDKPDPNLWWWAGGVLFGTMIEYAHYAGDNKYNEVTRVAMTHQAGGNQDFLTPNWTAHMGNDDQGFWGLSAMSAAELNFENPPPNEPQWLSTAQGTFNTMAHPDRHDDECGGGLRWQINAYSQGYRYKNSISNGLFFNLGARLARYTGNATYQDWAVKTWDWERRVGLMDDDYAVYDGAWTNDNCGKIETSQYTYNAGVWLHGAAFMFNHTNGSPEWQKRVEGLLDHMLAKFFPKKIAIETVCQNDEVNKCRRDTLIHKGVVHRWLANVAQLAPFTAAKITPVLQESAKAAVRQCTGGESGRQCGFQWTTGKYDGTANVATEMSVLSAVLSVLSAKGVAPSLVTERSGGTSKGDTSAGSGSRAMTPRKHAPITTAGRAGAGIITLILVVCLVGTLVFMVSDHDVDIRTWVKG